MGEIFGALIILALILCVKSVINDSYAEKQKEIQNVQKAVKDNTDAHYPILRKLKQDEMLGRWKPESYYKAASHQTYVNEMKEEARKRLTAAGITPDEYTLYLFFGGNKQK